MHTFVLIVNQQFSESLQKEKETLIIYYRSYFGLNSAALKS